jgi:hypothetical protein
MQVLCFVFFLSFIVHVHWVARSGCVHEDFIAALAQLGVHWCKSGQTYAFLLLWQPTHSHYLLVHELQTNFISHLTNHLSRLLMFLRHRLRCIQRRPCEHETIRSGASSANTRKLYSLYTLQTNSFTMHLIFQIAAHTMTTLRT